MITSEVAGHVVSSQFAVASPKRSERSAVVGTAGSPQDQPAHLFECISATSLGSHYSQCHNSTISAQHLFSRGIQFAPREARIARGDNSPLAKKSEAGNIRLLLSPLTRSGKSLFETITFGYYQRLKIAGAINYFANPTAVIPVRLEGREEQSHDGVTELFSDRKHG
ncbi:hypothetical protein [Parasphingorhabdus pacifica]